MSSPTGALLRVRAIRGKSADGRRPALAVGILQEGLCVACVLHQAVRTFNRTVFVHLALGRAPHQHQRTSGHGVLCCRAVVPLLEVRLLLDLRLPYVAFKGLMDVSSLCIALPDEPSGAWVQHPVQVVQIFILSRCAACSGCRCEVVPCGSCCCGWRRGLSFGATGGRSSWPMVACGRVGEGCQARGSYSRTCCCGGFSAAFSR